MSGHVNKPGVYENELGITLQQSIDMAGGMKGGAYKAAICGGISMGVLGTHQLDVKLDFDDVRFRGGCLGLGTAGMIIMNEHTDMVRALRNCVRFYAHESCGQCTPCREGSAWMRKILDRIVDGGGRASDLEMLLELEKRWASCPAPPSADWPTARPGRRARSSISSTKSSPRSVRKCRPSGSRSSADPLNVLQPMGSNTR